MNINDFKPMKYRQDCFQFIFKMQEKMLRQFIKTENISIDTFDINCFDDQKIFKDYFQIRFIEELNEATLGSDDRSHFEEEMIDAFNFLVEVYIIYGWDCSKLSKWKDKPIFDLEITGNTIRSRFYGVIESVGYACNLLKNRPWKKTQYLVDLYLFENLLKEVWDQFNALCNLVGIPKRKIFKLWSLKFQVNNYRIKTEY